MYNFPVTMAPFRMQLAIPSMLVAALCVIITVYAVCRGELAQRPSQLMRPKSPKPGKRVLLEKIPFIWNKFNFSHKVTARNLFRYKQRIFMTVVGIAGCTALMLTGFALKDSIMEIVDKQFSEISLYDMMIVPEENQIDKTMQAVGEQSLIGAHGKFLQETMTAKAGSEELEVYLSVPEQMDTFTDFIDLHTRKGKQPVALEDGTVVITEKFAEELSLSKGDVFTLSGSGYADVELTVGGIVENYTYHYVYMTPRTFREIYEMCIRDRRTTSTVPFHAGMLITDEPGYYEEGKVGIRIENILLVKKLFENEYGTFLGYEPVTYCPIDTTPVLVEQLDDEEIAWLNEYHRTVYEKLAGCLEEDERAWLKEKTTPISKK